MKEYCFTVTKTGWIHVEADSLEDAEAKLQENFGHYYVVTETGEELSNGWETTGEVELDPECSFNDYEEYNERIVEVEEQDIFDQKQLTLEGVL